jgi:hypothetical protein
LLSSDEKKCAAEDHSGADDVDPTPCTGDETLTVPTASSSDMMPTLCDGNATAKGGQMPVSGRNVPRHKARCFISKRTRAPKSAHEWLKMGAAIGFITLEPVPLSQRIGIKLASTAVTVISFRRRCTAPSIADERLASLGRGCSFQSPGLLFLVAQSFR